MSRINISFVQYGGMTYRTMIEIASVLNKNIFNVNYFWCFPGKDQFSSFKHPIPKEEEILFFKKYLKDNKVNQHEFKVKKRFIPDPNLPWIGTNFFEIFEKVKTDIIFCWRSGRQEFPFCHINKPIVEWNVFGQFDPTKNLAKSLAISPFCKEEYIKNGGSPDNSEVVYLPLKDYKSKYNFRKELGIDESTIVLGMHQRKEDTIFSEISLNAINYVKNKSNLRIFTLFLGGSDKYKRYAKELELEGHFIESTSNYETVSKFLNTLDIYTHARKDGETLGAAIQEAMIHKLPVISHKSQWNAHIETIGPGGFVCDNQKQYNELLLSWIKNLDHAKNIGIEGYEYALKKYTNKRIVTQIENIFKIVFEKKRNYNFNPPSKKIYRTRFLFYFPRYYLIKTFNFLMIFILGQRGTRILPKIKQYFIKLLG